MAPALPVIGYVASALGAAAAAKQLFSKPKTPKIQQPAAMPTEDDEAIKAAQRRQIAAIQARSGRASTILTDDERLGG